MFGMYSNWGPAGDFADVGNVLTDDTTGGETGTFANISTNDVRDGEFWGKDGTEFEGSLEVTGEPEGIFFLRRR
jgi:hypothetical protein